MVEAQPDWIPSRLFTTAGLRGAHEQEVRASAALMSIMGAVPTFSRALLKPLGAPGGRIETFTEVILKTRSKDTLRPDSSPARSGAARRRFSQSCGRVEDSLSYGNESSRERYLGCSDEKGGPIADGAREERTL